MQLANFEINTNVEDFKLLLKKTMKEVQNEYYNTILVIDSFDFPDGSIKLKELIFENNLLLFKQNNNKIELSIDFIELKNKWKIEKENVLSIIEALNFTLFSMSESYINNLNLNHNLIKKLEKENIL